MICDLIRSLGKGRPWMLMEQATGYVNWRSATRRRAPGIMRLGSYQALARGAEATMFFQWRASKAGAEKFHSAMLPHGGTEPAWREVTGSVRSCRASTSSRQRVMTEVAILFDWETGGRSSSRASRHELRLMPQVRDIYREACRRHLTLDFVHPGADLSGYRLVIAPALYLVDDRSVENIGLGPGRRNAAHVVLQRDRGRA